jgi:glycosyltransferase involved in cell wall biosynthesis
VLDRRAAAKVDAYIAVSHHIARRIRDVYGRDARVVYPPVEVSRFRPVPERSGRFLVVSRLVRSKRVELVVQAANDFALPLDVIGKGPERVALARLAGPTVRILGWQPDDVVQQAMAQSTAVVVAGVEDFGLVTAEAQASGRPPVAFAAGGACEIVQDGVTGYLFADQSPGSVAEAMLRAQECSVDPDALRASASRFDLPVFLETFHRTLESISLRRAEAPARQDSRVL